MVQDIDDSLGVFQAAVSPGHWVTKLSLGKNLVSAVCPHFPRLSAYGYMCFSSPWMFSLSEKAWEFPPIPRCAIEDYMHL